MAAQCVVVVDEGAPRIDGELLQLGIEVSQATVARYMARRVGRPSPTWRRGTENSKSEATTSAQKVSGFCIDGRPLWG